MIRVRFRWVVNYKPAEWLLHEHIKRHFRCYDAQNLDAAHEQLAENLISEFGLVDVYRVDRLRYGAWKIYIGDILVVGYNVKIRHLTKISESLDESNRSLGIMMDFQKLNGTRIPLTRQHIDATQAVFHESNHPVTKAIQATLGEDFTVLIYLLQEQIAIFQKNRDKINRKVGTLQTAGTLDEWLFNHADGAPVSAGHLIIYTQDENDDRLWIGFQAQTQ